MPNINLSAEKLEQLAGLRRQIDKLEAEFNRIAQGQLGATVRGTTRARRVISEEGRAAIVKAQKKRWARLHKLEKKA